MSLKTRIQEDMKDAMRARDRERLSTVRFLLAAIKQREVDSQTELDDTAVTAVIEKQIKQRRDSIQQYEQAGREDLAAKERFEFDRARGLHASRPFRRANRSSHRPGDCRKRRHLAGRHGQSHGPAEGGIGRSRRHGCGLDASQARTGRINGEFGSQTRPGRDPPVVHSGSAGARRHHRCHRTPRSAQEKGRELFCLLPVSWREERLVLGQPEQAVLSLLRLRRAWQRNRFSHGIQWVGICRSGARTGTHVRHRGAARDAQPTAARPRHAR